MNSIKQNTIEREATISGKGLHTGVIVTLTFKPAPENFGYKFKRIDLAGQPVIEANVSRVKGTSRGTVLKDGEVVISEAMDPAYEDDGQPSEMEEWHSFDPDC